MIAVARGYLPKAQRRQRGEVFERKQPRFPSIGGCKGLDLPHFMR